MRRSRLVLGIGALLLVVCVTAVSSARASNGTVVVTGNVDAKKQTTAAAAVTSALRQAKWSLVDISLNGKDVQNIQDCFQKDDPWPCLDPIASPKDVARMVLVELVVEKADSIRMIAQLATAGEPVSGYEKGYCALPCTESALAQSATDLVNRLLSDVAARRGKTFIEVISDPPGAAVTIDGRQLGPAGQKFPAHEGQHRVLLQLSGHRDVDTQVEVVDGETKRVALTLEPLEQNPVSPIDSHEPPRLVQWALIGGGAALLVGGSLYSYGTALDRAPPAGEPRDSEYLYNGKALAVAGIGGAAAIVGLVWLLRTPKAESKPTVSVSHGGVQAAWSITF